MAHMCTMEGCKEHKGMCKHEKMMLWMAVMVIVVVVALYVR